MQASTFTHCHITTTPLTWTPRGNATNIRPLPPLFVVASPRRHHQITHSMPLEKVQVFKSLDSWASKHVLQLLKPVEKCWQPNEFLPDPTRPINDFTDEIMINTLERVRDETGASPSPSPWAYWTRAWTAEENRHGNLLWSYLHLSGRVDILMIERTVQYLIGAEMVLVSQLEVFLSFII
ncbi:hypothetical protein DH2020_007904 [Rehmannia glutinosa]|uniref:Uncharacterized protein n=1 Tax=Rehmannia glutinosa TaxID=99300 RepID=A0ABR0U0C4_REHGL